MANIRRCRICCGPPALSLYDSVEGTILADIIADFANVMVTQNDGKPTHICLDCSDKLRSGAAFQKQIQEAETLLETLSGNDQNLSKSIKIELDPSADEDFEYEYLEEDTQVEPNKSDHDYNGEKSGEQLNLPVSSSVDKDDHEVDLKIDEWVLTDELRMDMESSLAEDKDLVKFPFEMPPENLIVQRMKFDDFEYLEIDGDRCCGCSFIASNRDQLIHHSKEKHSHNYYADSSYTCPTCYQKFQTQDKLANHIDYYSYSDIFLCTVCNESFVQKSHLKAHQESSPAHQLRTENNPKVNTKTNVTRRRMRIASNKHTTTLTQKNHVNTVEVPCTSHFCCFVRCWEGFESMEKLLSHVQQAHDGKRRENEIARLQESSQHFCQICQRTFENESKLLQHQSYKQNREKHVCQECGQSFFRTHALRDHELKAHSQQQPEHECEVCGKAFMKMAVLKHHRKIHIPFENVPCTEPGCEFVFRDEALMKRHHRNVHGASFPWECGFCPKKMRTKEALDIHVRMHTGEKPFGCRQGCDRGFAHATDRARHERAIHTGVRPHQCDKCSAAFVRRRELVMHLKKHAHFVFVLEKPSTGT